MTPSLFGAAQMESPFKSWNMGLKTRLDFHFCRRGNLHGFTQTSPSCPCKLLLTKESQLLGSVITIITWTPCNTCQGTLLWNPHRDNPDRSRWISSPPVKYLQFHLDRNMPHYKIEHKSENATSCWCGIVADVTWITFPSCAQSNGESHS